MFPSVVMHTSAMGHRDQHPHALRSEAEHLNAPLLRVARISEVMTGMPAGDPTWLSASERMRLQRLQVPARRAQYLSGHWLVRCLLAQRFGGVAADYALEERPSLPPAVTGMPSTAFLTLSHSADWIACALSEQPIGIDIEQRQPPREALLRFQHLLLAEDEAIDSLGADALLQRWVIKEAWIKRHHGSALPEQLAGIRLRRVQLESANVSVLSNDALHLGISTAGKQPADLEGIGVEGIDEKGALATGWLVW